jgi:hypothetical protein
MALLEVRKLFYCLLAISLISHLLSILLLNGFYLIILEGLELLAGCCLIKNLRKFILFHEVNAQHLFILVLLLKLLIQYGKRIL